LSIPTVTISIDDPDFLDAEIKLWGGFRELFFARTDRIGRRLPDVISETSGKPVTGPWRYLNFACKTMQYQAANLGIIASHLSGETTADAWDDASCPDIMLQTYMVDLDGSSVATAVDLDVKGESHADVDEHFLTRELALEAARKLMAESEVLGLNSYIEITKSAGYRHWTFHKRCSWTQARDLGKLLVKRAGFHERTEVFPVSAPAGKDSVGSAVFVPFWGVNARKGRQVMIDPTTEQPRSVDEFVAEALAGRTSLERLAEIVSRATESGEIKATAAQRERSERTSEDGDSPLAEDDETAAACWQVQLFGCEALRDMVQRCSDGNELSRAEWMKLASHLKAYGDWGLAEFHLLSACDSRYSEHETDTLWDSLLYGPTTCAKMECGLDPQDDCGVANGKLSSIWFAYQGLQQLPTVRPADRMAKRLHKPAADGAEDVGTTAWSPEKCVPDPDSPWSIRDGGVWHKKVTKDGDEYTRVIGQVVQIIERARDLDEGGEHVMLRWNEVGPRKDVTVPRRTISDIHAILALADQGLAVNSVNARQVVAYLAHLLDYHQSAIPVARVVSSCGHKRVDGHHVFVYGNTVIGDQTVQVSVAPGADPNGILKAFGGDSQWQDAPARVERWVSLANRLGNCPVAAFGIGAGILPVLLADMKLIQNPVIDFGGKSSSGKSTLLRLIASMWGLAPEIMGGQVRSWSSTPVFVERLASLCNDLPIFLDESHNARPEMVQNIVYQYANGTGKGRGTKDGGVQSVSRYRGVLFSAGEARLADSSAHDGVQGRVLGFWGSPFGSNGQSELVAEVNDVAASCYGLVGIGMATQYMQRHDHFKLKVQAWQAAAYQRLRGRVNDNIGERLAAVCAAVDAACRFACEIMQLTWDVDTIIDTALERLTETRKADSAQTSLELLGSWAAGRMDSFIGEIWSGLDGREVLGREIEDMDGSRRLAFLPDAVKRVLEQHKYPYSATLSHWKDRGWLETDNDKGQSRSTKKMRLQGRTVALIALSPLGMQVAMGLDSADDLGIGESKSEDRKFPSSFSRLIER